MFSQILQSIKHRPIIQVNRSEGGHVLGTYVVGYEWRLLARIAILHPFVGLFLLFSLGLTLFSAFGAMEQLFARSGALLVASAVFLDFRVSSLLRQEGLKLALEEVVKEVEDRHDHNLPAQLLGWENDRDPRTFRDAPRSASEAVKILEIKERPYLRLELVLASVGTVIWAFGDWGLCWIMNGSVAPC